MKFYDILNISPEDCKVHLAQWNGAQEPLDLYFSGEFQHWQERQSKRYFERKFILSLIRYQRDNLWLFVGVYESKGVKETDREGRHYYNTELSQIGESLRGRLIINYKRQGRIAYPNGESLDNVATVYKITPEPIAIADFPGFKDVLLSRKQLNIIFSEMYPSWKSALSSASGVYLISDTRTGKLYVGSASGGEGIWQRWMTYNKNYHGQNAELRLLYDEQGPQAFDTFLYSILEVCDIDLSSDLVIEAENRWKKRLLSREFGLNKN